MQRPDNLKVGDQFRVTVGDDYFKLGEIVSLKSDDGSDCPFFWNADKTDAYCAYWSDLEPHTKTVRDAQVGDVVIDEDGDKYKVLERGQNTVIISYSDDFKFAGRILTFDELEKYHTLKAE